MCVLHIFFLLLPTPCDSVLGTKQGYAFASSSLPSVFSVWHGRFYGRLTTIKGLKVHYQSCRSSLFFLLLSILRWKDFSTLLVLTRQLVVSVNCHWKTGLWGRRGKIPNISLSSKTGKYLWGRLVYRQKRQSQGGAGYCSSICHTLEEKETWYVFSRTS